MKQAEKLAHARVTAHFPLPMGSRGKVRSAASIEQSTLSTLPTLPTHQRMMTLTHRSHRQTDDRAEGARYPLEFTMLCTAG